MAGTVERLEQVLCNWEDKWFVLNTIAQILANEPNLTCDRFDIPMVGPVVNFYRFRKYLREFMAAKNMKEFDEERFIGWRYLGLGQILKDFNYSLLTFPKAIASWTLHSRRAFHLSADLQVLLNSTILDGIYWRDVSFPFRSFAVCLEIPIVDHRGCKFDCVLVGEEPDHKRDNLISFRLFDAKFGEPRAVSLKVRENITKTLQQKRWAHANELLQEVVRVANLKEMLRLATFFLDDNVKDAPVTSNVCKIDYDGRPLEHQERRAPEESIHFDAAVRIVVGLCLYLQTLPPGSSAKSEWKKHDRVGKKHDPRAITNDAQVCTVSCTHKLTAEERKATGSDEQMRKKSLYELCAHFRRGHWRRPPGQGHIPDAPRIVWVRPTLVRRDRLAEGQLPGGAEAILK